MLPPQSGEKQPENQGKNLLESLLNLMVSEVGNVQFQNLRKTYRVKPQNSVRNQEGGVKLKILFQEIPVCVSTVLKTSMRAE